ncbi:hypothetical protein AMTR_s00136p00052840 [Amborella trichopoda]|uniref:Uncharacterized protein n=1 Tax=Amborella trichopoda TaxID=13333 RepID=W1NFL8_AMBTC|nr:hypothetical protein AMTR_s00136p00052840 [Amborella trichopoda]
METDQQGKSTAYRLMEMELEWVPKVRTRDLGMTSKERDKTRIKTSPRGEMPVGTKLKETTPKISNRSVNSTLASMDRDHMDTNPTTIGAGSNEAKFQGERLSFLFCKLVLWIGPQPHKTH